MFKKFFTYPVILIIVISIIFTILFGSLLRHHYQGGEKFKSLQKIAVFFAEIPSNIKFIITHKTIDGDVITSIDGLFHKDKELFTKKLSNSSNRDELILISRHDGDLGRSIVEIRDLNTFEVIHSYLPNIESIYKKIDFSKSEFDSLKKDIGINRFYMWHPIITSEGGLIFQSNSPLVKVDFNSKVIWINDEDIFHHSINTDHEGNIYVPSHKNPYSEKIIKYVGLEKLNESHFFADDAINILDKNGKIFFSKSVSEILIEHGFTHRIFAQEDYTSDPIHLNDIQPVLYDGPYYKKGDLFLSIRNLSMVILYRPSSNKIIKIIEGNFFNQHDVDILDDENISIYNNNSYLNYKNERQINNNEILIYNFATDSFSKKFDKTFKKYAINTGTHGLIDYLKDGSAIVEDRNNGRIFYLNSEGEVVWIFNNLDSKKQIYDLWWSRIISPEKSKKLRKLIMNQS